MRLVALVLALVLAGCSLPEPPPATTPSAPSVPVLTPTLARETPCGHVSLRIGENATVEVGTMLAFQAVFRACGRGAELAPLGQCGTDAIEVTLDGGPARLYRGAAYDGILLGCGSFRAPDTIAIVPPDHDLARIVTWNGTITNGTCTMPSEGAPCPEFRAAVEGLHRIHARAVSVDGHEWTSETEVFVTAFCATLELEGDGIVFVDGLTVASTNATGRWCGVPGFHAVRVEMADGTVEEALLPLETKSLLVRAKPVRVEAR